MFAGLPRHDSATFVDGSLRVEKPLLGAFYFTSSNEHWLRNDCTRTRRRLRSRRGHAQETFRKFEMPSAPAAAAAVPAANGEADSLSAYKLNDLKQFCRDRMLRVSGNKAALIARIRACTTHPLPPPPPHGATAGVRGRRPQAEFKRETNRTGDPSGWQARPRAVVIKVVDLATHETSRRPAWRRDAQMVQDKVNVILSGARVGLGNVLGRLSNHAICIAVALDDLVHDLIPLVNSVLPTTERTDARELTSALLCGLRASFINLGLETAWPFVVHSRKPGEGRLVDEKLTPARTKRLMRALTTNSIDVAGNNESLHSFVAPTELANISQKRAMDWLNRSFSLFAGGYGASVTLDDLFLRSDSKGLRTGIDVSPTYIQRKDGWGLPIHLTCLQTLSQPVGALIVCRNQDSLTEVNAHLASLQVAEVTTDRGYTDPPRASELFAKAGVKSFGVLNDVRKRPFTTYDLVCPAAAPTAEDLAPKDDFEVMSMPFMGPAAYVHTSLSNPQTVFVTVVTRTSQAKGKHGAVTFLLQGYPLAEVEKETSTYVRIPLATPVEDKYRYLFACKKKGNGVASRVADALSSHGSFFCASQGSCNAWGMFRRMTLTALGASRTIISLLDGPVKDNAEFDVVRAVLRRPQGAGEAGAPNVVPVVSQPQEDVDEEEMMPTPDDEIERVVNPYLESDLAEEQLTQELRGGSADHVVDETAGGAMEDDDEEEEEESEAYPAATQLDTATQEDYEIAWQKKAYKTLIDSVFLHKTLKGDALFNGKHTEPRIIRYLSLMPFVVGPEPVASDSPFARTKIFYLGGVRNKLNPNFGYSPDGLCMTKLPTDVTEVLTNVECKSSQSFSAMLINEFPVIVAAGSPEYHEVVPHEFMIQLLHQAATANCLRTLLGMAHPRHMSRIVIINYTQAQLDAYRDLMDLPIVRGLFGWLNDAPLSLTDADVLARLNKSQVSHYHYAILASYVGIFRAVQRYHSTLPASNPVIGPTLCFRNAITDRYDCEKGATDDMCTVFKNVLEAMPFVFNIKGKLAFGSVVLCASAALRAANIHRAAEKVDLRNNAHSPNDLANFRRTTRGEKPFKDQMFEALGELLGQGVELGTLSSKGFVLAPSLPSAAPATPIASTWRTRIQGAEPDALAMHISVRAREVNRVVSDADFLGSTGLPLADACLRKTPGQQNIDPSLCARGAALARLQKEAEGMRNKYLTSRLQFWNGQGSALRTFSQLLHLPVQVSGSSRLRCFVCSLTGNDKSKTRAIGPVTCAICVEVTCENCFSLFHSIQSFTERSALEDEVAAASPVPDGNGSHVGSVSTSSNVTPVSTSGAPGTSTGGGSVTAAQRKRGSRSTSSSGPTRRRQRTSSVGRASAVVAPTSGATVQTSQPAASGLTLNLNLPGV
jgi:hypothetical protein